jgi:HK97 family phage major capsid protein
MTIKALRQKRADLIREAQTAFDAASAESRGLNEAEAKRDDAISAELGDIDGQIERAERQMERQRSLTGSTAFAEPGAGGKKEGFESFGHMLGAVHRAAVSHQVDPRLIEASLGANEAVPSDGGYLVETDTTSELLKRTFEQSAIAARVRKLPISARSNGLKMNALKDNSRANGSRWGGVQGYWLGEGDTLTPSRPKFRQMELNLKKLTGLIYATDEMLQDGTALQAVINEAFPEEFAFLLDDAIFEGSGTAKPLGFMNAGCKIAVSKETGQAAATILFENITKMWARLTARSMKRAEWWINQDAMPQLMALSMVIGTGGVPVYLPPGGLSGSPYGTLMGRPVIPLEYCETLGTEGDIVLVDPSQYVMIDKGDIQQASSLHVAFLTAEQAFRFIYRVDGQPVDDKPITPFKGTLTQSSFVTLATRA